jgi:hypothetical protein
MLREGDWKSGWTSLKAVDDSISRNLELLLEEVKIVYSPFARLTMTIFNEFHFQVIGIMHFHMLNAPLPPRLLRSLLEKALECFPCNEVKKKKRKEKKERASNFWILETHIL